MRTIETAIREMETRRENANWIPACGGKEIPFMMLGFKLLYVWNGYKHGYLNMGTDMILSADEESKIGLR
jgi:hypothetical protein